MVLQDATVLAIDQVADERVASPAIAKSVTLEVDTVAAQKLDLAASLGTMSLILRKAGETGSSKSTRVSLKDLFSDVVANVTPARSTATITVKRGAVKEDYTVPIEHGDNAHPNPPELAGAGQGGG